MSATAAALAALAVTCSSLGVECPPIVTTPNPGRDTHARGDLALRMLDDVDPRVAPLVRRGYRPWTVTRPTDRLAVYRSGRVTRRYRVSIVFRKHAGPTWDRATITVRPR